MVLLVGHVKPFTNWSANWIELGNEFSTLVVNYHLMCFTDFVPEPETKEYIGDSLVLFTVANLAVNLAIVGRESIKLGYHKGRL